MSRRQSADCLSDLQLDRWLADEGSAESPAERGSELTADERQRVTAHVETCPVCRQRHAELSEQHRRFARDVPAFASLERPESRAPGRSGLPATPSRERPQWLLLGASALAAAAAASLFLAKPWQMATPIPIDAVGSGTRAGMRADARDGMRVKGAVASLGWVVRRGEHVFTGRPEQALRSGDALRFTVSAHEPVYVAVLGLDATESVSVYHPAGDRLTQVEAGQQQPLPGAIELDATPGDERLYGVFCTTAVLLSAVTSAVERSPEAPALPEGCSFERWTLSRESP